MNNGKTYEALIERSRTRGGGFLLLIDPDRIPEQVYLGLAEQAADCGVDADRKSVV